MASHQDIVNLIWQIADLLRGPYRPPQYERVMLPMTVLRRFDCVLAPTKNKVLAAYKKNQAKPKPLTGEALDKVLSNAAGQRFHNHSPLDFAKLKGDPDHIDKHLVSYINGFSANVRRIFDSFEFGNEIERMRESNILYLVVSKFADVDLHPRTVDNIQMGLAFENLIRRFNELANETAGDHFTPREVIRLMVDILFDPDDELLRGNVVRTMLDPACGTGGMLAEAQRHLRNQSRDCRLYTYGQDYNKRAFATAASDMLIKEVAHNGAGENIKYGDSLLPNDGDNRGKLLLSDKTYRLQVDDQLIRRSYLALVLGSRVGRHQVEQVISGAAGLANNIAQSDLKEFVFPVPPVREQDTSLRQVESELDEIVAMIAVTERTTTLLSERRSALIAAAVTGQIGVEDAA